MNTETPHQLRFIRMRDLTSKVGLSRSEIYRRVKSGRFPQPIHLGARAVAWSSDLIEQWQVEQIRGSS